LRLCDLMLWCALGFLLSAAKITPEKSASELTRTPSKAARMFSGTQDKCATCGKTAYPLEKVIFTTTCVFYLHYFLSKFWVVIHEIIFPFNF